METTNSREERRRRIAERGSDRMALITGRAQSINVPYSTPSSPPRTNSSDHTRHFSLSEPTSPRFKANLESRVDDNVSTKYEASNAPQVASFEDPNLVKPLLNNSEIREVRRSTALDDEFGKNPSTAATEFQKSSKDTQIFSKSTRVKTRPFSSKRIILYIAVTENTRIFGSLAVALFVVLSHLISWLSGIVIALRPLFLLLLTDITMVVSRLYLEKPTGYEEPEEETGAPQATERHIEGALRTVERGLVVYQTLRALFIDCSVYSVVVVCGLYLF